MDQLPSGPMPERRTILVTDDSSANRDLLSGQLSTLGFWTEAATNGEEAYNAARRLMPDLILMDIEMPVMNGHDACKRLKTDPKTAEIPILMMTGFDPRPERTKMVESGGDDLIVKPVAMRDLQVRVRALLRLKELRRDLRSTQESLRELVKKEDPTEARAPFDDRVALTAQALARLIGLDAEDQEVAFHAGLLHDIGQIGLPEELLNRQGSLSPEDFARIQQHTILGAELAGPFRPATVLAPAIRHHHERWDGTGYPDKLQGPAIPMMARIVSVADAFHAMITDRPYRAAHSVGKALEILAAGSGSQWDPRLCAAFATSSLPQRIAGVDEQQAKIA
ncbi:MAG TPA: HD domain-containing phosphohydrolase [Candidatus Dormibacteraeota bacterium]|nr:HD domain-containing phosphohydrolase [Candidatus Dormibacteraeota bacterium]